MDRDNSLIGMRYIYESFLIGDDEKLNLQRFNGYCSIDISSSDEFIINTSNFNEFLTELYGERQPSELELEDAVRQFRLLYP